MGLAGYYRKFVPHFTEIAVLLTEATKKDALNKVKWTNKMQQAFDELKKKLISSMTLMSPDTDKQFTLQMDASGTGIGTVLSRYDDENVEIPVAFYSRKLLSRERAYSTVELEFLAVVNAVQHFRVYFTGVPFVVVMDHKCLQYPHKLRDESSRQMRWALTLQPYNYKVKQQPGKENANADALSRQAWSEENGPEIQLKEGGMSGSPIPLSRDRPP